MEDFQVLIMTEDIIEKKKEEDLNPENQAKKNLMKGLFGGLGGEEEESKPQKVKKNTNKNNNPSNSNNLFSGTQINKNNNNSGGMNLFEGMIKNNDNNTNNTNNQNTDLLNMGNSNQSNTGNNNNNNFDLLGFGDNTQQQNNTNINNNSNNQGSIDLLGDIFGGGNSTNNFGNNNNNTQNQNNIFDVFSNNTNTTNTMNNNTNDIFGNLNNNTNNNNSFSPYNISTDEFGELWGNYPDEDTYEMNINISTPQQFHDVIKNKGNYAAIDIINNEAISAANYKNQISLVHATIDFNHVTLLVKCQNKGLNQEVSSYIIGLFK